LNRLVASEEILCGGDDIEDNLDSILLNPIASTISKWRMFKLMRCVQLLNQLVDLDEWVMALNIVYCKLM
jgi:hypothetical protein